MEAMEVECSRLGHCRLECAQALQRSDLPLNTHAQQNQIALFMQICSKIILRAT